MSTRRGSFAAKALVWALVATSVVFTGAAFAATGWQSRTDTNYIVWSYNEVEKFRFNNTVSQWEHSGAYGTQWQVVSATGLTYTGNIGDGAWHTLGNGYWLQYSTTYDLSYFKDGSTLAGSTYRFRYKYGPGQWESTANTLSWQCLGAAGLSAAFVGTGDWYNLGNGFTYQYLAADDVGTFRDGAANRFRYLYATRQWENTANSVSWQTLGNVGLSAAFLGSGGWWNLGNGFTYQYATAYDIGYFKDSSTYRFRYRYGTSQWESTANALSWQVLGTLGLSAEFVGSGAWYALGNGFTYQYTTAYDIGYFKDDGAYRFRFRYGTGQWENTANALYWGALSSSGLSAAFVATGAWYDLGNGFTYQYSAAYDTGYFKENGSYRFRYRYGPGQWEHRGYGDTWGLVGLARSEFIGDGSYHSLNSGLWYRYGGGLSEWSLDGQSTGDRFHYTYASGKWELRDYTGAWASLVSTGKESGQFIGDGAFHNHPMDWSYRYLEANGQEYLYWKGTGFGGPGRYRYCFQDGQWEHRDFRDQWLDLGSGGKPIGDFIIHGGALDLGNGFQFAPSFDLETGNEYGTFATMSYFPFFEYSYSDGRWSHSAYHSGGYSTATLSASGASGAFLCDGEYHDLTNGFWYRYGSGSGIWSIDGQVSGERFRYGYSTGQWDHKGSHGDWHNTSLGPQSCQFIGDGAIHDLGASYWYQYVYMEAGSLIDVARYFNFGTSSVARFEYAYASGAWSHRDYLGQLRTLGMAGKSTAWINGAYLEPGWIDDGAYVLRGWYFWIANAIYNGSPRETAYWTLSQDISTVRFEYEYDTGQWWHRSYEGPGGAYVLRPLGPSGRPGVFIGNGRINEIGNGWYYWFGQNTDSSIGADIGNFGRSAHDWSARFAYQYATGQWYHHGASLISDTAMHVLGAPGQPSTKLDDGYAHDLGQGWVYWYENGNGYWRPNGASHSLFLYEYDRGIWNHWATHLGRFVKLVSSWEWPALAAVCSGEPLSFGEISFQFDPSTLQGWWAAGTQQYYNYNYVTGVWSAMTDHFWEQFYPGAGEVDVQFVNSQGTDCFIQRLLVYDPGLSAPYQYKDLWFQAWQVTANTFGKALFGEWRVNRPGADDRWTEGRPVNALFLENSPGQVFVGCGEYTVEDTIVFEEPMYQIGFNKLLDYVRLVNLYFGPIDTLAINSHGSGAGGGGFGECVDKYNYGGFRWQFTDLGNLLKEDGQLLLYMCQAGDYPSMLNDIAGWMHRDVFAHEGVPYFMAYTIDGSPERNDAYWNHNFRNVRWREHRPDDTWVPLVWEYRSDPNAEARQIFEEREW